MNYDSPFYLMERRGNNAFAWEQRGPSPQLFVPGLVEGDWSDVRVGQEVVFADVDEHGALQECVGLERLLWLEWDGVPCVVVDNHNHVFYFWYAALARGLIEPGAALVHVDQHKDMREPERPWRGGDLDAVFEYTNQVLNVGNYIRPAMDEGLIGEVQLVTGEADLGARPFVGHPNLILNVDLDFFAPEMAYIDFEAARDFIRAHAVQARFITIATSPFFVDQSRALDVLQRLTESG